MVTRTLAATTLALFLAVTLTGCPATERPPYNAAGSFVGTWSGEVSDGTDEGDGDAKAVVTDCPIELNLIHDPSLPFGLGFEVAGVVNIDPTCLIPDWMQSLVDLSALDVPIPVVGTIQEDGSLALGIEGCPPQSEICIDVLLDGLGVDEDEDGILDVYGGTLSVEVAVPDFTLEIEGTFEVFAVVEDEEPPVG